MDYSSTSSMGTHQFSLPQEERFRQQQPPQPPQFRSALHTVRRLPAKPWKKPIAPLPPTPARVYKVNSADFKQVVQKLTAAPEFQSRRLQSVAPPPLSLLNPNNKREAQTAIDYTHVKAGRTTLDLLPSPNVDTPFSSICRELMSDSLNVQPWKQSESLVTFSPLGFSLSPSSWCSFPLLSPGTLSSLEQSTVL
ncbi:VQ motif-containing protein [Actinidia chinensis var. chinensis]|uniref:VQ motif-containing protein n=1 Tax=Actinidia chinensis var. chinensis TaxID=1590841 RepID=A0A2R6RKW8_ACTCC|nr:VQ motif-containing protein [Actinidia chinensis var. chinensis]